MFFGGHLVYLKLVMFLFMYVCADGLYLITSIWNKHYIKQPTRACRSRRGIIPKRSIDRGAVLLSKNKHSYCFRPLVWHLTCLITLT